MPTPQADYTGTHNWDTQLVANITLGHHGTAAESTNPYFRRIGGRYVAAPTSGTGSADVILWLDQNGYLTPHLDSYALLSTTTAGTQTTTQAGSLLGVGGFKAMSILVNVASTVGSTATLNVYIDSRFDGTTWLNVGQFDIFTTAGQSIMVLNKAEAPAGIVNGFANLAGIGTVREIGYANDIQVRYSISGATSQFTFTVYVNGIG